MIRFYSFSISLGSVSEVLYGSSFTAYKSNGFHIRSTYLQDLNFKTHRVYDSGIILRNKMEDFKFNKSALFYKSKPDFASLDLKKILNQHPKNNRKKYYKEYDIEDVHYKFIMFKANPKPPSFYKGDDPYWNEERTAYILIVFNDSYVAILKQNTLIPKKILDNIEQIEYEDLLGLFICDDTEYKHLSMRNIDGSDYAIRTKTYDAVDLKRNISTIGASKFSIQNMRGKNDNDSFALCVNTSRINQYNSIEIAEICEWAKRIFSKLNNPNPDTSKNGFLSRFAKHVKFSECKGLTPSSLLIYTQQLLDLLQNVAKETNEKIIETIRNNERLYERVLIDPSAKKNDFAFKISEEETIHLKILNSKIILKNKLWANCKIEIENEDGQETKTLENVINENNLFSVFFREKSMTYSYGQLFSDNRLLDNIGWLLSYIEGNKKLANVNCEKFDEPDAPGGFLRWGEKSEFKFIEDTYKGKYKCLICDDCETEWADYIGISDKKITFFACKHSDMEIRETGTMRTDSYSASKFHDVIAQALKNLGNLNPSESQLTQKQTEWKDTYLTSFIKRTSSSATALSNAVKMWTEKQYQPNFEKEFVLVVNFLSKKEFENRFLKTEQALNHSEETRIQDEAAFQQIWLLSSFISTCLESGVTPKVICNE